MVATFDFLFYMKYGYCKVIYNRGIIFGYYTVT